MRVLVNYGAGLGWAYVPKGGDLFAIANYPDKVLLAHRTEEDNKMLGYTALEDGFCGRVAKGDVVFIPLRFDSILAGVAVMAVDTRAVSSAKVTEERGVVAEVQETKGGGQ